MTQPSRFDRRWQQIRSKYNEDNIRDYNYIKYTPEQIAKIKEENRKKMAKLEKNRPHLVKNPERYFNYEHAKNIAEITSGRNPAAIRHMPVFTFKASAQDWMKLPQNIKRYSGFTFDEDDINNDGFGDIIVYDSYGRPYAVNGYILSQSRLPLEKAYYTAKPTKKDREIEKMNEWVNKKYWGITDDYKAGIAELPDSKETEALFAKMKASGYQVPKKPKNFKSLYTVIYERFLEPRFELGVSKIIENKYKYSLIRKEIYRVLKSPKIISIFYNQDIKIIFYLFVPKFDRELLTPEERIEIFGKVEGIMETEEMSNCFFAYFFTIYEKLLQIIDTYNTQVNENNKREMVYNMKEEVKEFLKNYEVPDEILPDIDTDRGTFTGPRPTRDIKLFSSPQRGEENF